MGGGVELELEFRKFVKELYGHATQFEAFEEFVCCHLRSHKASQESALFISLPLQLSPHGSVLTREVRLQ